jgi:hypothetical protein
MMIVNGGIMTQPTAFAPYSPIAYLWTLLVALAVMDKEIVIHKENKV